MPPLNTCALWLASVLGPVSCRFYSLVVIAWFFCFFLFFSFLSVFMLMFVCKMQISIIEKKWNYPVNTLPSHHFTYDFSPLQLEPYIFIQKEFLLNFKLEWLCLQILHMRISIYFDLLCRDAAMTWKRFMLERRDYSFVKTRYWL